MTPAAGPQAPLPLAAQFCHDLADWCRQVAPLQVLAIGRRAAEAMPGLLPAGVQLTCLSSASAPAALKDLGTFDLAVITDTVEQMAKPAAEQLLGSLRDLHAHHLLLLVPIGTLQAPQAPQASVWEPGDLLALGMSRAASYRDGPDGYQLYHFALDTYKPVPDWLNSQYWAHPERFAVHDD